MNTQSHQQIDTTETEIDLVALLKRVCVQWRAILIFSIIIGLLASGIKYAKDVNAYNASLSTQKISGKEAVETSGLKQEEIDAVQQAVSQKRQIKVLTTYTTESEYMNLDAMNCRQLSILYYIKADRGSDAADLLAVYNEMLQSDDSVKAIKEAAGVKVPAKYIRELISAYDAKSSDRGGYTQNSSTDVMKITFNLPEGADSKAVEETIEKLIKAYDVTDLGIAKGKIRKISSEVNTVMNENMQTDQQNYTNNLSNLKSTYNTAVNSFSDEQKTLLDTLLEENGLSDDNTEAGAGNTDVSSSSNDTSAETATAIKPSFSKKYFAVGFVIGILLYVFLAVIVEILGKRCSAVAGSNSVFVIGSLFDPAQKKKNFIFRDRLLEKCLYRNQSDLDSGIDRILTKAQMNSSQEKLAAAELWTVGFDGMATPAVTQLVQESIAKGITLTVKSTADGKPDDMLTDVAPDKSIILAVQDGISCKKDATFLTEMLYTRKADYLGQIELL